jgi:transposase-like protein
VQSWGVLIIKGIGEDGQREILRGEPGHRANETTWAEVFKRLWERGLRGVV